MSYFVWSLPLLAVALCMASGRVNAMLAGLCGGLIAAAVALWGAPLAMTASGLVVAIGKGLWLAWLVIAVILSGLFFREIVSAGGPKISDAQPSGDLQTRRRVFFACFLIGPFAEAATGFGVGQVTTVAMLQSIGLPALDVVLLGLFSQVLVSWGAMANGTVVGAAFAGLPARDLGIHSAMLSAPLLLVWLVLFWRMTARAGLTNSVRNSATELATLVIAVGLLLLANAQFGPEIAGMAALAPLILLQFWRNERPDAARWRAMLQIGLPYAILIAGLAASRGIPLLNEWLRAAGTLRPFAAVPAWSPFLHPGSWLAAVGIATALLTGRLRDVPHAMRMALVRGRSSVTTIAIYMVVAQIMSDAGMAAALAAGLGAALGPFAVVATPWLAGAFGFLTGSSNASNGLLMASQVNLSTSTPVPAIWIAALQNSAAAALTMLSPARIAMGCALVKQKELEAQVYRNSWGLGAAPLIALSALAAAWVLLA
ncbi:L-lactate permease [Bradyrhizobium sp. U87765 SZCCT0131]|uniref:L-lactate permease n=1 Tax=unclassified Bradyrhizobium TaxID=2631580 RepID=UPI001BAD7285|nr:MULTISPECIES: L-lactate permease [unclassified Bradyrhizobium]MBR1217510.1 L-lactate permease [Bradyrhizobium sp. U87765 SZCCT0131]MBR1264892.1 L-lactate permease [Bradyrhizobium sp. U87765 SZCCT0134]MBR1304874.1 L-lactate permease [Bradyrhizobium sp. U87765 SZCCT0110]MBR1320661.1 L-lactate permease [Bradyrhizobium sp. U87765 SZCCT0109]MBR1349081.1 L-lactate permease [Bradyrhizobium sp. U87765 SZCCT0048]